MLPIPFINYIPKMFRDRIDTSMQALTDKADEHLEDLEHDVKELAYLRSPERCPVKLLSEMDFMLNAGFKPYDTETTKRRKVYGAIEGHKNRGLWTEDTKIRIDAITGYSSSIFRAIDSEDAILLAGEPEDPDYYWCTMQDNSGTDDDLGLWLVGDFTEYVIGGIFYIDCHETIHVSTLTADQIEQIIVEIQDDIVPAYYRIYLGYVDTTGSFVKYSGGQIH